MTTAASRAARRLWRDSQRVRRRFRRWRRGRPFWGGTFLMLGGVQLFLSTQLSLGDLEISFGPEGYLAILLPAVLLLCGVLLWATPQHRHFYSVIGVVTAIYSLLGLNLGGWFLGMLLGIVGGALGFSWTAVTPAPAGAAPPDHEPAPEPDDESASEPDDQRPTAELPAAPEAGTGTDGTTPRTGEGTIGPLTDQPPGEDQTAPVRSPRHPPRTYLAVALPLAIALPTLLSAALTTGPPAAALPADHCLLPILCPHETPSPSPTPEPSADPDPGPGPEPTPSGDPTVGPTGPPAPRPTPTPTPSLSQTPDPTPTPTPIPTLPPPADQPIVAAEPALLTADRLNQEDFQFEGITELPTATGTIEVLQFSFSRSVAANFALEATADGETTRITADPLTLAGDGEDVTFYTSRFVGRALGVVPLELTPDSPLVDLLELVIVPLDVFFTDVDLDLVFTSGAVLTAEGFRLDLR